MVKNKKAQMIGQVFIFLLAIAIFSLIIIYGYKAISSFTEKGETVALLELQNQLQRQISAMALDYGSTDKMELRLPTEHNKICFVDYTPGALQFSAGGSLDRGSSLNPLYRDISPFIIDAIEGQTRQNVFLVPLSDTPIQVANMTVESPSNSPGILCLNATRGKVEVLLEGSGKTTKVSSWQTP